MGIRSRTARVLIRWPTQQQVPRDGSFNVYRSPRGSTAIDYGRPINRLPIPAWPADLAGGKVGSFLGPFGAGAFGLGHGGFGFGNGPSGLGGFGFGAAWLEYLTGPLEDGLYAFAVVPRDGAGNEDASGALERTVDLAGDPYPPSAGRATEYEPQTATLTVTWTPDARNAGG